MRASLVISFTLIAAVVHADTPRVLWSQMRFKNPTAVGRNGWNLLDSFESKAECEKWAAEMRANPVKNDGMTKSVHYQCFPAGTDPRKPG